MKETHFFCLCLPLSASHLLPSYLSPVLQSQSQLPSWDRAPAISPADMRTDVFTARPSRSQSFRDPPLKGLSSIWIRRADISGLNVIDPLTCSCFLCLLSPSDVDPTLCGIERQRPGSLSSALGAQSHAPSFPALPRPSGVSPIDPLVFISSLSSQSSRKNVISKYFLSSFQS